MTNFPLINVSHLNKDFLVKSGTVKVLKDINFEVADNSFTVILGPSGSGKTTLLNALSGLEVPTSGQVKIANQNIFDLKADARTLFRAQNIGFINQTNYWIKSLDVLENVALPLYLTGRDKKTAITEATKSLEQVNLMDFAHYQPNVLSSGQQQRVSMARALAASPKLILADEPTGNLDSENGAIIMDLLLDCQHELNRTIVLVTHNIEYLGLSDIQLYLFDGQLTETRRGQKLPPIINNSVKEEIRDLTKMENK